MDIKKIVVAAGLILIGIVYFVFIDPKRSDHNERMRERKYDYDEIVDCFPTSYVITIVIGIIVSALMIALNRLLGVTEDIMAALVIIIPIVHYIVFSILFSKKR